MIIRMLVDKYTIHHYAISSNKHLEVTITLSHSKLQK